MISGNATAASVAKRSGESGKRGASGTNKSGSSVLTFILSFSIIAGLVWLIARVRTGNSVNYGTSDDDGITVSNDANTIASNADFLKLSTFFADTLVANIALGDHDITPTPESTRVNQCQRTLRAETMLNSPFADAILGSALKARALRNIAQARAKACTW